MSEWTSFIVSELQVSLVGIDGESRFSPFLSVAYGFISINQEGSQFSAYDSTNTTSSSSDNIHVVVPSIGTKFRLAQNNALRAYLTASVMYSIPILARVEAEGTTDPAWEEDLAESLSALGANGGIGMEYFLAEQFSLGGELLVNVYANSSSTENTYDGGVSKHAYTGVLGLMQSLVSFNFYW